MDRYVRAMSGADRIQRALWHQLEFRPLCAVAMQIDSTWGRDWQLPAQANPYWRFMTCDRPGAWIWYAGKQLALAPEQVMVVPAYVDLQVGSATYLRHFYTILHMTGLSVQAQRGCFRSPVVLPVTAATTKLLRMAWSAAESNAVGITACSAAMTLNWHLLGRVLDHEADAARFLLECSDEPEELRPAMMAINQAGSQSWTIPQLAALCGLSLRHFQRLWAQRLGCSPSAYARRQRLHMASVELLHPRACIDRIAVEYGFTDRAHFGRAFKQEFGLPPGRFRRLHLAGQKE